MPDRGNGALPATIDRAVRSASVAPHVRAMFDNLPQPIRVDAELPEDAATAPASALALVKLAVVGSRVRLGALRTAASARIVASLGERACVLEDGELRQDLRTLARRVLSTLFEGSDVARLLESFAFQSSSLSTLQRITRHMLQATDAESALYVMLSGITSGYGLAFNRAALFVHDDARGTFVGSKAVGPADAKEAHRIWEEIELEEKTLEETIADASTERFDTRFQQRIQAVELAPGAPDGDEIARALASPAPVVVRGAPRNASLAALDAEAGFALAAVRPHGKVLGLVFADNRWSGAPVSDEQLAHFGFYIDQTALVWENLSLLRRVETLARTDGLTGVLNRRELDRRMESERSRCERSGASCSVAVIDVDRFKEINDTSGHAAGDDVLRRLGALLATQLREHDVAARLGGDEFVVLLPDAPQAQLVGVVRRLGALARADGISLSIGGASWPGDAPDVSGLLASADAQLYAAKRAGRGCGFVRGERVDY